MTFERQTDLYTYIDDISEARQLVGKLVDHPWCNHDTETAGHFEHDAFNPRSSSIRLSQWGIPEDGRMRSYIVDHAKVPPAVMRPVLESKATTKIGHNLKFDLKHWLSFDIRAVGVEDTMVSARTVEAGMDRMKGHHNLHDVATRTIGVELNKDEQASDWGGELTQNQITYAAMDVQYGAHIASKLRARADQYNMGRVLDLEAAIVPVTAWMEWRGIHVDAPTVQALRVEYAELLETREALVRQMMGQRRGIKRRKMDMAERDAIALSQGIRRADVPIWSTEDCWEDYNLNSGDQIKDWMRAHGIAIPIKVVQGMAKETIEEDALKQMDHPFAEALLEYRQTNNMLTKYIEKILTFVDPVSDNVHTRFDQNKDSGRFSASEPPLQQIPRESSLRSMFCADPGDNLLIIADFSQIELVLIAMMSMDPTMCGIFKRGDDLHAHTTRELWGMNFIPGNDPRRAAWEAGQDFDGYTPWKLFKANRAIGKTFNFGSWYGAWVNTLARIIRKGGGNLPLDQIEQFLHRMHATYPVVPEFFQYVTGKAYQFGYSETIIGRKRFYDPPVTKAQKKSVSLEANNTTIQGSGADIMKAALVEVYEAGQDLRLTIHDEAIVHTKAREAERNARIVEQAMLRGAQKIVGMAVCPVDREVPIKVDVHVGPSWAEK